ncbi:hypothetical protein PTTG_12107 [Puccinia triticina 1-1 BBBD Race 1]|uniref:OPT family small oligopeptide transporter n=2 Tax=Puccinia triticina TaxID=208348 RepID=A0A180GP56_PUCT1|nr:uncharacterized protein PtA15_5A142 [Puccinia triticina]OAV94597.1 hypothetical protein PTTG_12107 [Puccinia triticina 1-1 BBBD Race 1]WAQ84572.1 hypothetical protein PtA15_5A142 [Puccinia triticina]
MDPITVTDMDYCEKLYRQASSKKCDRFSYDHASHLVSGGEKWRIPPSSPRGSRLPRTKNHPILPERTRVSKRSQRTSETKCKFYVDPDDFYRPFDNQFVKRDSDFSLDEKPTGEVSAFDDEPTVSPNPIKPGGMKPLDPTDDVAAPVITLRSVVVGITLSLISAAIAQLFQFKPVRVQISLLTLQILSFLLGTLLSKILPTRYHWLNPGPYSIKEDVFATMMAASAAYAAFGTEIFAPQILFLHAGPGFFLSVVAQFANQLLAICLAWHFRSFLVYPAACLYPAVIPPVILFQSLHGGDSLATRRINLFKLVAPVIGLWEILPQFLAPAVSAINVFCLALPASKEVTALFGGASPNTGFGLFSLSLDWTNISAGVNGASPMYVPWIAQVNSWIGLGFAILMYLTIYKIGPYASGAKNNFPLLSTSLLTESGKEYNHTAVFLPNGSLSQQGLAQEGLPAFTLSFVTSQAFAALLMTSAVTQAIIQNWTLITGILFPNRNGGASKSEDPHLQEMEKYSQVPQWFLGCISVASVALGYLCATLAGSQMGFFAMLASVLLASIIVASIGFLNATTGFNPVVAPACQMIGSVFGGSVIRSLWFSIFSATCATISLLIAKDVKMMIYTKVPPRKGFFAQICGTIIGVFVNQFVMQIIVSANAEALIEPTASGQFSGVSTQALFNEVSTWSLFSHELYGPGKRYFFIPASLFVGFLAPLPFLFIENTWPNSIFGKFNVPLVAGTIQVAINGTTSGRVTAIVVGFISQYYVRIYRPQIFTDYNHVLSAALDGGTQIAVLLLSFATGKIKLPHYLLNPAAPFLRDYCTRF